MIGAKKAYQVVLLERGIKIHPRIDALEVKENFFPKRIHGQREATHHHIVLKFDLRQPHFSTHFGKQGIGIDPSPEVATFPILAGEGSHENHIPRFINGLLQRGIILGGGRVTEGNIKRNHRCPFGLQFINQLGVNTAGPRPMFAQLFDGRIINPHHDDGQGRLTLCC